MYYGSQWRADPVLQNQAEMLNTYFQYLTNSPYMDILRQYSVPGYAGIGHGSWVGQDFINTPLGRSLDDGAIQDMIATEIDIIPNIPPTTANTLYVVFTPPGSVVTYDGTSSATGFEEYSDSVNNYCGAFTYVVIPYPSAPNLTLAGSGYTVNPRNPALGGTPVNAFQQLTAVAGAEMADAITNGWFDGNNLTIGELGRAHPSDGANPYYFLNDYLVQQL